MLKTFVLIYYIINLLQKLNYGGNFRCFISRWIYLNFTCLRVRLGYARKGNPTKEINIFTFLSFNFGNIQVEHLSNNAVDHSRLEPIAIICFSYSSGLVFFNKKNVWVG